MNPNETQVGGSHYKAGLQHWDYTIRVLGNRYLEGNITKYVTRFRKKHGLEDLNKAAHYLDKLIETCKTDHVEPLFNQPRLSFNEEDYFLSNSMDNYQISIHQYIGHWSNVEDLYAAREILQQLIQRTKREDARLEATKAGAEPMGKGYVDQD